MIHAIMFVFKMCREDAQNRLLNMSDEDKQQIALHKSEVKELQRQYDRDVKLQDFLSIKGIAKTNIALQIIYKNEISTNAYIILDNG